MYNDSKQKIKVYFIALLQLYKILMGTFLTIFIPQQCEEHVCTIPELFVKPSLIFKIGFMWNIVSFLSILSTYMIEIQRENWLISHLEYDEENMMSVDLIDHGIERKLKSYNFIYLNDVRRTCRIFALNYLFSAFVIMNHYADYSTITSYISFAILILSKLNDSYKVAEESYKEEKSLSAYIKKPLLFTAVDLDLYHTSIMPGSFIYQSL